MKQQLNAVPFVLVLPNGQVLPHVPLGFLNGNSGQDCSLKISHDYVVVHGFCSCQLGHQFLTPCLFVKFSLQVSRQRDNVAAAAVAVIVIVAAAAVIVIVAAVLVIAIMPLIVLPLETGCSRSQYKHKKHYR